MKITKFKEVLSNMKKLTKVISFSKEYKDEYEYIRDKKNASSYICKLIRADIKKNQPNTKSTKEKIKEIILEIFNEKDFDIPNQKETKQEKEIKETNKYKKNKFIDPMDSDDDEF